MGSSTRSRVLQVGIGGLLLVSVAIAESNQPDTSPRPESTIRPEAGSWGPEMPTGVSRLRNRIAARRAELRALPGRAGLLREESIYSVFDEEVLIRDFFQDRKGGIFVDVGCAWPVRANNTYYLEHHLGWTGIGIDALDDYAEAWKQKRPGSVFLNFLVTDASTGMGEFYRSESLGLSSTSADHARARGWGGGLEVEKIEVPTATLTEILDGQGLSRVDLLALDIEGHEFEALKGFDFERFRPELIIAEGARPQVQALLSDNGYHLIERYLPFDTANRYFARSKE